MVRGPRRWFPNLEGNVRIDILVHKRTAAIVERRLFQPSFYTIFFITTSANALINIGEMFKDSARSNWSPNFTACAR
jgi:hypothetical protein